MKFEIKLIQTKTIKIEADDSEDAKAIALDLNPNFEVERCDNISDEVWDQLEVIKTFHDGYRNGYDWLTHENWKHYSEKGGYVPGGPFYFQYHNRITRPEFHGSHMSTAWREGWKIGIDEYKKSVEAW